jgi:glutathione S-transferase
MITLWGRKSSINVQKVLWILAELGLKENVDFKQIDAGLHFGINKTPEYLKLNPNGLVPTLEDGELVLWESNSIMRYLAKKYDSKKVFPNDLATQAASDKWMDWQISTLWPALRIPFLGLTRIPEEERDYVAIRNAFQESNRLFGIFDGVLANQAFCSGKQFSDQYPDKTGERAELKNIARWYHDICINSQLTKAVQ